MFVIDSNAKPLLEMPRQLTTLYFHALSTVCHYVTLHHLQLGNRLPATSQSHPPCHQL